ncbi:hypothetical protein Tco_0616715, partial [Tanacetum coccineum]
MCQQNVVEDMRWVDSLMTENDTVDVKHWTSRQEDQLS